MEIPEVVVSPTAQPYPDVANPSPDSMASVPRVGLATRVQDCPDQRTIRVSALPPATVAPAARAVPPGANATALSWEPTGTLTVTFCHAVPVHRMLIGGPGKLLSVPTANAVPPGPAAMPSRGW